MNLHAGQLFTKPSVSARPLPVPSTPVFADIPPGGIGLRSSPVPPSRLGSSPSVRSKLLCHRRVLRHSSIASPRIRIRGFRSDFVVWQTPEAKYPLPHPILQPTIRTLTRRYSPGASTTASPAVGSTVTPRLRCGLGSASFASSSRPSLLRIGVSSNKTTPSPPAT